MKERVLTTFQQTLTLFKQGRTDEVVAGCNLLLQMDPMFDPAKKLLAKLRNPELPLDVDSLLPAPVDQRSAMEHAREAMAARDFERVIQLTSDVLSDDLLNDEARVLGDEAREKVEAAPFVEQFTRKAEQSLAGGNGASAKMELEKARALDPTHPEVVRIGRAIDARSAAPSQTAPSPSFVVDAPAAGGRAASPAADFGFTFEEEKPPEVSFANFSFDTPAASDFSFEATQQLPAAQPPASPKKKTDTSPFGGFSFDSKPNVPAAAEFDFATASVLANEEDQKKIDQYLADGDRAFEAADYSQAIDLWSRIFLIDVTNDQASDRIERAKMKRRELEGKAETLLASGIEAFERGDTAKAHAELTEVLRLDPRNTSAQEHLDRLGETVEGRAPAKPANVYVAPPPDEKYGNDLFDDELSLSAYDTPLVPPDPSTAAATATAAKAKTKAAPASEARKLPLGLIAIVLGVLVLGGGGWFVWSRMSTDEVETAGEGESIMARATMLAKNGRYDQAIALLRDIKPGDPKHNDSLVMIADLQKKKSTSAALIDGIPAAEYYEQRAAAGAAAFAVGDYVAAKAAFEQALRVKPLSPDLKAQYDTAAQQASKLDAAKALFSERRYSEAIANLQPLLEAEPQNASIRRMVVDAHFNLGAMALQEERIGDAVREMDEVLQMDPTDELARRSKELAVRYNGEPKDLLYKIYVKYLPLRAGT